ncbi:MAG: hypothetical protein M3Y34_03620 [Actinomycetota bacterium]|nr:hypothetical protein [Actinomycetota bacterium]
MKGTLTALVAALALAGCGGGEEPEPESTGANSNRDSAKKTADESPNTSRFIGKADGICARFNDRWVGVPEATPEYYRDWKKTNAKLEALEAPARISTEWDRFLAALDQQFRFTKAEDGLELKQAYERKEDAAQEIGFADCSGR